MKKLKQLNQENIIFFDIETVRSEKELTPKSSCYDAWVYKMRNTPDVDVVKEYNERASLFAPFLNIVCITIGKIVDGDTIKLHTIYGVNEKALLTEFNDLITRLYVKTPTLLYCGFNSNQFDLPMITKRMLANGIDYHSSFDKYGMKPWEVPDVDLSDAWKGNSYAQDSLVAICQALGIESPKDELTGAKVGECFYSDDKDRLLKIAKYCEKDVVATVNVFKKFRFEEIITKVISNIK